MSGDKQLMQKLRLKAYSHLKAANLLIMMNIETAMSKYLRNNIIILCLLSCTDQNHYTCSKSEKNEYTLIILI